MKLSKLFKIGLPLLGVVAVSTALPLALTSCNSNSSSSDNTTSESLILEPIDMSTVQLPEHNFQNSFQQAPATISSLAEANKQLQQQWDSLSEEQKGQALKNDLENWALTFSQTDPYYSTWQKVDQNTNDIINRTVLLPNDPHGKFDLVDKYNWRFFQRTNIQNFSFVNGKLNVSLTWDRIFQLATDGKVVSQFNYKFSQSFTNAILSPVVLAAYDKPTVDPISWASSFILTQYDYKFGNTITNIISNNQTPIDEYFASHVNKTQQSVNSMGSINIKPWHSIDTYVDISNLINKNINSIDHYENLIFSNGNFTALPTLMRGGNTPVYSKPINPNVVGINPSNSLQGFCSFFFASPTLNKLYKIQP